jgi:D-3-phosphoglycerate dehydrogenase
MYDILVTSTSFIDTPGKHQEMLASKDLRLHYARGPLTENEMLAQIAQYDALLCGDDALTENVIRLGKENRLICISKYGVGLDKIDLQAAKKYNIPVTNCPGVNQVSVAEHFFGLLLCFLRNIHLEFNEVQGKGTWKRMTGHEIFGKKMLIMGLGRIGSEIAKRASAFGLELYAYDQVLSKETMEAYSIQSVTNLEDVISEIDIISLNLPLTDYTKYIISASLIQQAKKNLVIVNTARGELVDQDAIIEALTSEKIAGYITDVLDIEPMPENHPLRKLSKVLISPHIGSRTLDSVQRQGVMAVENLFNSLKL